MGRLSRANIRRLRRQAAEHLDSFELRDGGVFYFDRQQALRELFVYAVDYELGRDPEPPEIWRKILEARDPESVLATFRAPNTRSAFVDLDELYETERIER